ncbi:hypothetical protein COW91_00385 [Candidatus Nomurabacteria bacterium CG22_combo_CG10-13_8_21_14_all_32_8]|uniref:Methyltransferase FkbM domain-containing protein n=1 Tax=Candidatus Nomurabacteria bacterium CG22_combo_CG10-13_8_21_14_all_32_8 TaxID=1974732 RepID=A0A2H0CIP0_9BACT|nr:MAG: hypothetical protein COW91_00385 [Candidatus Nomurabacteria bacterium CG22_combo_CG10-13_8_21_14_all_32_8]
MAFQETNIEKIKKLIKNPKENYGKIFPFVKSKIIPYMRDICEFFGIERYSKPYPGHKLLEKYITKKNGFFVQCGGNDGYGFDPTYYLEKFKGWRGVIVEPLPISSLCQRNRKKSVVVQSACVGFDYPESTISFIDCNFMSFVKDSIENSSELIKLGEDSQNMVCREIIVPAKTVQSIIDEQTIISKGNTIDLFVADVEGYELQILQGLDFSKNSPSFFLLEIQNSERLQMISEFLLPHKYSLLGEIGEKDYLFMKE